MVATASAVPDSFSFAGVNDWWIKTIAGQWGWTDIATLEQRDLTIARKQAKFVSFEFSDRGGVPDTREVIPMGPPDRSRAAAAVARMEADGGTPIGAAMIDGKRALDATGLSRKHLLVITDGENTTGAAPADVAAAIGRRPLEDRPSLYFVAFDISARRFDSVRNNGGLVLEAANAKALNDTLDSLLRGKILIER